MVSISQSARIVLAACLALSLAVAAPPAFAKRKHPPKETQTTEQPDEGSPDVIFAKSLVGKTYDDDLVVDGWEELDGGLVSPPIYVHRYQREDGTYLVLTSRETTKASKDAPSSYEVTDALIVAQPKTDLQFSIACVQGKDETLDFMGEAKGGNDKEWWIDVRRAWQIALDTGIITSVNPKGIRCTNPSWGQ